MGLPFGSSMHIQPFVPAHICFICPLASAAITAACWPASGGAALTAFAIVAASDLAPPFAVAAGLDFALGLSGVIFMLSCAKTVQLARTRTPVTAATSLRISVPPQDGLT